MARNRALKLADRHRHRGPFSTQLFLSGLCMANGEADWSLASDGSLSRLRRAASHVVQIDLNDRLRAVGMSGRSRPLAWRCRDGPTSTVAHRVPLQSLTGACQATVAITRNPQARRHARPARTRAKYGPSAKPDHRISPLAQSRPPVIRCLGVPCARLDFLCPA